MTKEEILNMEAGREMDALVGEKVIGLNNPYKNERGDWVYEPKVYWYEPLVPKYSTSISAAWEMEEKIKELVLQSEYDTALCWVLRSENPGTHISNFCLIHATSHQRCRAALLVVMEK